MKPATETSICLIALAVSACATPSAGAADIAPYKPPTTVSSLGIGERGDGSSVFPNERPPIEVDEATGKNLLWKIPTFNWCYGYTYDDEQARLGQKNKPGVKRVFLASPPCSIHAVQFFAQNGSKTA